MARSKPASMISARAGDMIEVVAYLAEREGAFCRTSEIASAMGLERKTICETLRHLVAAGIVESRRGKEGGYRLCVSAQSLTLWDLVESVGTAIGCGIGQEQFGRWRRAKEGMRAALKQVTVAQMID